jgi:hypothetical protein
MATGLVPILFQRLVTGDTTPLLLRIVLPIAFIIAVFVVARWLERRTSKSGEVRNP